MKKREFLPTDHATREERAAALVDQLVERAAPREIREAGSGDDRQLEFVTSDETVDSYGDIIRVKGWDLSHYRENPQFLWQHQNSKLPIGRSVREVIDKAGRKLRQVFEFFGPDHPDGLRGEHADFADTIYRLFKGWRDKRSKRTVRGLSATSVGFLPKPKGIRIPGKEESQRLGLGPTGIVFERHWLKETSAVTVPANPSATITASFAELFRRRVIGERDLEILDAFDEPVDWLSDLRREVGQGRTISIPAAIPEDVAEEIASLGGEKAPESADRPEASDGSPEAASAEEGAREPAETGDHEHPTSGEAPRALSTRDLTRTIDNAILALSTIRESIQEEEEEDDAESDDGREMPAIAAVVRAPALDSASVADLASRVREVVREEVASALEALMNSAGRSPAAEDRDEYDFILSAGQADEG